MFLAVAPGVGQPAIAGRRGADRGVGAPRDGGRGRPLPRDCQRPPPYGASLDPKPENFVLVSRSSDPYSQTRPTLSSGSVPKLDAP